MVPYRSVVYSKKDLTVVTQVFKAETGEKLIEVKAHEDEVLCCAFSSDDSYIATCSVDKKVKVQCWSSGSVLRALTAFAEHPHGSS